MKQIVFSCDAKGDPQFCDVTTASVILTIGENVGTPDPIAGVGLSFRSKLTLSIGGLSLGMERIVDGYALRAFSEQLGAVMAGASHSASLSDWNTDPMICFSPRQARHKVITVSGRITLFVLEKDIESLKGGPKTVAVSHSYFDGVVVVFDRLTIEPPNLRTPILQLQQFVYEHRVECQDPSWL